MEPEGSLPLSRVPATCPYPEPDQSSPFPHPTFLKSILILRPHLRLGLQSGLFPSGFLSPILATCPVHLMLLDVITLIIFGEIVQIIKLLITYFSPLYCYLVLLGHKYPPQHPLFSNTLSLRSSLNMLYTTRITTEIFRQTDAIIQTLQSQATNQ